MQKNLYEVLNDIDVNETKGLKDEELEKEEKVWEKYFDEKERIYTVFYVFSTV